MEDARSPTTAGGLAAASIDEKAASPSPPDSGGGIPVGRNDFGHTAAQKSSNLAYPGLGPAIDFSSVNVPRLGVVRVPTTVDFDVEDDVDEQSASFPCLSITSSPVDSTHHSVVPVTPPDLRLGLQDGEDPVREQRLKEPDRVLINDKSRSRNEAIDGDIDTAIDRAARTGHGLPTLEGRSNVPYEPSEKSNVTDLGAQGLQIASKAGNRKPTLPLPVNEAELKKPIQDRLLDALQDVPGHEEKKGFFPEKQLQVVINERCVKQELELCFKGAIDSNTLEKCAQKICGTEPSLQDGHLAPENTVLFKKIFVTLVLSEKTSAILLFLADNVTDRDLPLSKVPRPGKSSRIFDLARKGKPDVALGCFREWTALAIRRFEEWQWTTLAPYFYRSERKDVGHWLLQDQNPLPFTADSRYDEGDGAYDRLEFEGGFSKVFKVDIHPEHHGFHAPHVSGRSFAIKRLLSRDRDEFKREVDTLMKFSGDTHRHLVSLLATYEQFRKFYLIFHWAEADLQDYWKEKNPAPMADYETVLWMAEQCSGIADGLSKIHRYESSNSKYHNSKLHPKSANTVEDQTPTRPPGQLFGRHGDIKPENVLWFRDPNDANDRGILKITDFGLTEFSTNHSISYKPKSKVAAVSPSYRPPECDLQGGVIGRSYDIWTLGCLYLELITWLLGGWELVQEFQEKREAFDPMWFDTQSDTFFEIVKCKVTGTVGAMVKPAVTQFILTLHYHPRCTEYIHNFLNLIRMDMLIVKPPNPKDKGRISCEEVVRKLFALLEKCRNDNDYASKPTPWTKRENEFGIVEEAVETDVAKPAADILRRKQLRVHDGPTQRRVVPGSPAVSLCCEELLNTDEESLGPGV